MYYTSVKGRGLLKKVVTNAEVRPKIGVVTGPINIINRDNLVTFEMSSRLLKILEPLSAEITWVNTNCVGDESKLPKKVTITKLEHRGVDNRSLTKRLFYHLLHQIRIILELRKLNKKVDVFIFAYGGHMIPLPFLFAALFLRKKTILRIEGRSSIILRKYLKGEHGLGKAVKIAIYSISERLMYSLAHRIAIEYEYMVERYNLQKWRHKISLGSQYVDITFYKKTKELTGRTYQVGYIGRFSTEKGTLEFAQSLPQVLRDKQSKAVMIGDGNLREEVEKILTSNSIEDSVVLTGWIENKEIPYYLNDMRLLVIPSYSEGVPNIALEAMASGTPILATCAGGLPEIIKDEWTGFLTEDNSPECIARNILRALNHTNLEEITANAHSLMEKKYSYEATVERYRNILSSISPRDC